MYLSEIPTLLKVATESNTVPLLLGSTGIGKSQVVKHFAITNGFDFIDLRVGQQETGDLIGLPRIREVEEGVFKTVWAEPEWWPKFNTEKGILFLDEINRPPDASVIQALFQVMLAEKEIDKTGKLIMENGQSVKVRRMHTRILPSGWRIIAAANPDTQDYQVQTLDRAFLARFIQIIVVRDLKSSVKWMRSNLHEPEIANFVQQSGQSALGKDDNITIQVDLNGRAYEMLDDLMYSMEEDEFNSIGLECIKGCIGEDIGQLFFQHMKDNLLKPINGEKLLNTRTFDKLWDSEIKRLLDNPNNEKRTELLDVTLSQILHIADQKALSDHQLDNLFRFLEKIPSDMSLNFCTEVLKGKSQFAYLKKLRSHDKEHNEESLLTILTQTLGFSYEEIGELETKLKEKIAELEKESK